MQTLGESSRVYSRHLNLSPIKIWLIAESHETFHREKTGLSPKPPRVLAGSFQKLGKATPLHRGIIQNIDAQQHLSSHWNPPPNKLKRVIETSGVWDSPHSKRQSYHTRERAGVRAIVGVSDTWRIL